MATQNLAIMFTDIKGFTERTSGSSRDAMRILLAEHERLLGPVFAHFDGRVIKTIGDAFLVTFVSPTDAVLCGLVVQEVLRQHNAIAPPERRLDVRVAINVGEVEQCEDDVLGEPVNIAARLEGISEAGEVWFTDAVYQTMNRAEAPAADIGEKLFKGIPYPVRVYRAVHEPGSPAAQRLARGVRLTEKGLLLAGLREASAVRRIKRKVVVAALLALLAVAGLSAVLLRPSAGERAVAAVMAQLQRGESAAALESAHAALQRDPGNRELVQLALKAAGQELDRLGAAGDYTGALGWLDARLHDRAYLAPLAARRLALEAQLAVAQALADPAANASFRPQALLDFLARHPAEPAAPRVAAQVLGQRGEPMTRLWLQREALERGLHPDDAIFRANIQWQEKGPLDWQLLAGSRSLLLRWYPRQTRGWAATVIEQGAVLAFLNAWAVLEQAGDARLAEPYFQALKQLAAAPDAAAATGALAVLGAEQDPARRAQLMALLAELVASFPLYVNSGEARDAIVAARARFATAWNLP